jgi:transposase
MPHFISKFAPGMAVAGVCSARFSIVRSAAYYADHLPLYRQSQIYARSGIDLERSTLADWVGGAHQLLSPLIDALGEHVLSGAHLHADDTPYPVLAPGAGKTKIARIWTYVRDERSWGSTVPAAVWFRYTSDRKGIHPHAHLSRFTGALHADGYAGFDRLFGSGRIQEIACWAHCPESRFIWSNVGTHMH